ncbi:DUF6161 domain-containing protein [Aquimarina litoralis]|uniref:DUF6161 domain-containing protein n=1 Tax=Aquimarina litoralis TaxID=584605 RepID=UPI001C598A7E|nr:DUF6161 domain-containing protein [Aquimarina litoralis]MBW1297827.1 hypothetical protein [Aquimarina litoralis]
MKIQELKKLVNASKNRDNYETKSIYLEYIHAGFNIQLVGIVSIYNFFSKQYEFYSKDQKLPYALNASVKHFRERFHRLEELIEDYIEKDIEIPDGTWFNVKPFLEQKGSVRHGFIFNKESPLTSFLIKLESEMKGASLGGYDFFTDNKYNTTRTNKSYFVGWHLAFEFFMQDNGLEIVKRRKIERASLNSIRRDYLEKIHETDAKVDEHITKIQKKYSDKDLAIKRLAGIVDKRLKKWELESKNNFLELISNSNQSLEALEKLYKDKIKLEAPVEYWRKRAVNMKNEGDKWLTWLIIISTLSVLSLAIVLISITNDDLKDIFQLTGSGIKWSLVFITFISFLAYGIRTFSKLMFSSYHLYRDAQEREQLTYVYLSLSKETNLEDVERNLIMQSLFSRVDSGLLKDDASPTMPGGIIEKVIGK